MFVPVSQRTPQEQKEFRDFLRQLDNRNFTITPSGEKFKGSAINAKHRALEILDTMPVGSEVRVVDSTGTIFYQQKR